jgi:hypothetical protein
MKRQPRQDGQGAEADQGIEEKDGINWMNIFFSILESANNYDYLLIFI